MPVIIVTGIPCSGKTSRTLELKNFFESKKNKKVQIISEEAIIEKANFEKNDCFSDSKKERLIRGDIKSSAQRLMNPIDILIIDGSNYIKGFRYELYCVTKLYKSPQCTVQTDLPVEHAWLWNERRPENQKYTREVFDALILRYEPPDNKNRWDKPLFIVNPDDELQFEQIYSALFEVEAPKPNLSTQNPPLSTTNYLYDMDRITQEIVTEIVSASRLGVENNIKISNCNVAVTSSGSISQLTKLRRQFLIFSKKEQFDINKIPTLFVQYLNKNL